jgi:hypothetical protein
VSSSAIREALDAGDFARPSAATHPLKNGKKSGGTNTERPTPLLNSSRVLNYQITIPILGTRRGRVLTKLPRLPYHRVADPVPAAKTIANQP